MAQNIIKKLVDDAIGNNSSYIEFKISIGNLAFTNDGGKRKSTKNYKIDSVEIDKIEKTLKTIDERSLLFSGRIKRIKVELSNGKNAEFIRTDNKHLCVISGKKWNETKPSEYLWARFVNENKTNIGVAFMIKTYRGRKSICPCKGCVMNGMFNTGIDTDLQFIISGDFRFKSDIVNSINSESNTLAAREVGVALDTAIANMIQIGLLGMSLFSVLPSTMDDDTEINLELIKTVKQAFQSRPIFRNRTGRIVGINKIIYGTDEVLQLFPQELINRFFVEKYWLEPCPAGSREEYFLIDIGVTYYDREKFLWELFVDDNLDELSEILSSQRDKWLRDFYIFCSSPISEERIHRRVITALCNMKSIRDSKGKMRFPYEVSLLQGNQSIAKKTAVIKNSLINPGERHDDYSDQIEKFFLYDLRIGSFSLKKEMEQLAYDMMSKKQPIDNLYCDRLVTLAKFDRDHFGKIDFDKYTVFPYESSRGIRRAKACELVIGKPYFKEGSLIASTFGRKLLWNGFAKILSEEDCSIVVEFAINHGAIGKPIIIKQKADEHISFSDTLYAPGKQGNRDTNYDYTIIGLDEILRRRSIQLSKLVWMAIAEVDNPMDTLNAEYSVDNRSIVNRDDSTLIKILRERTWVPGKDGKFYMPKNILIADINEEFVYNRRNPILKQLHFGSGVKEREKNIIAMKKWAEKEKLRLIPEEEYQEFLEWKKSQNKKLRNDKV